MGGPPSTVEAEELLQSNLRLQGQPQWQETSQHVKTVLVVNSDADATVYFDVTLVRRVPWLYHLQLRWEKYPVRRLDVRDSHSNPHGSDGQTWSNETHKHAWREEYGDGWAYTPDGLPIAPGYDVAPDEYREVFEAFCAECGIDLEDFVWVEPTVTVPTPTLLDPEGV